MNIRIWQEHLKSDYWAYTGSLATPPCTENVQWYVMTKPAVISGSNVLAFKDLGWTKPFTIPLSGSPRKSP